MTVTQLECFLAIVQTRSFGRAAAQLAKAQAALSVQIQRLETDLGVTLFERSGRQVRLTSAGETLIPHAERILSEMQQSRAKMLDVKGGMAGVVRVGVLPTVAAHFLPPVLGAFRAKFPGVVVVLREENRTANLVPLVQHSEIDLCIALLPLQSAGLKSCELLREDLCLAVSRDHPLSQETRVSMAQLVNEKFIMYKNPRHSTRELTIEFCRKAGFEPAIEFESEQAETIQNLVAANLGVTVLPDMVLENRTAGDLVKVKILPPAPSRTIVASWKPGHYLSTTTRQFLECTQTVGRQWRRERPG
jgi:LysR family hydrogen peroxide-inducible transcriptional activator